MCALWVCGLSSKSLSFDFEFEGFLGWLSGWILAFYSLPLFGPQFWCLILLAAYWMHFLLAPNFWWLVFQCKIWITRKWSLICKLWLTCIWWFACKSWFICKRWLICKGWITCHPLDYLLLSITSLLAPDFVDSLSDNCLAYLLVIFRASDEPQDLSTWDVVAKLR